MKYNVYKSQSGVLKVFDKIKKFNVQRVFSINIKKNEVRGGHGHKIQNQILLLIDGEIEIIYLNINQNKKVYKIKLKEGDHFIMKKNVFVSFKALKKSQIIALSDQAYDPNDYFYSDK